MVRKKVFLFMFFSVLLFLYLFYLPNKPSSEASAVSSSENYIVRFRDNVSVSRMNELLEENNLSIKRMYENQSMALVELNSVNRAEALEMLAEVQSVTVDKSLGNSELLPSVAESSLFTQLTDPLYVSSQWHIRRVMADQAWSQGYTASHDTVVGIIDVGVANNHPDLQGNIVYENCFTSYQPTCAVYPQFPSNAGGSHGTRVAGIVGGIINGVGIVGVSPNVGIANLNVAELDQNGFPNVYESSIWAAINDAIEQDIDVLNLSFGFTLTSPLSQEERDRVSNWIAVLNDAHAAGITLIASAGNSGLNLSDPSILEFPCELQHVICVGATSIRPEPVFPQVGFFDEIAFYSNYSSNPVGKGVDIAAPGGDCGGPDFLTCLTAPDPRYFIWTSEVQANSTCAATESCPVTYTASIGTSYSAPHVAGVAALVADLYKNETGMELSPSQIRNILQQSADPFGTPQLGAGIVNAQAAIEKTLDKIEE